MIDNDRYLNTDIMFDTTNYIKTISDLSSACAYSTGEVGNALNQVSLNMDSLNCVTDSLSTLSQRIHDLEIAFEEMKSKSQETNQFLRNIKW